MSKFSGEAEYQTFSLISSEVIWLKRLLLHFEFTIPSIMLFCDSKSAIDLTSNEFVRKLFSSNGYHHNLICSTTIDLEQIYILLPTFLST